jgi:methyltransferase (TIGR00027 family)
VALRKLWLDDQVQMRMRSGTTQVLVIAAGYDTLAYRLAQREEYSNCVFWEIDHPATARVKEKGLAGRKRLRRLHNLPVHLERPQELCQALKNAAPDYDPRARTIVVVEGLLYYLREEHVRSLFKDLQTVVGPGSVVLFDFFEPSTTSRDPDLRSPIVKPLLRMIKEPFQFAIACEELGAFFAKTPWKITTTVRAPVGPERLAAVVLDE